jgi:hypothetical protein
MTQWKMVQFAVSIPASLVAALVAALVNAELQGPRPSLRDQQQDAAPLCAGWKALTQEKFPLPTVMRANSKAS